MIQMDDDVLERLDRLERLGWAFVWVLAARTGSAGLYRLVDLARAKVTAEPEE
jgi:hypothetical protein